MKPNPERNWSVQFWGVKDEHHAVTFRGTIEDAFARADSEECEVEWEVVRVSMAAIG